MPFPPIIQRKIWVCKRCGNNWVGRLNRPPVTCPRCRSKWWFKERKPVRRNMNPVKIIDTTEMTTAVQPQEQAPATTPQAKKAGMFES